jgi:hypothetical protein
VKGICALMPQSKEKGAAKAPFRSKGKSRDGFAD